MREIEIKARLSDKNGVIIKLQKLGVVLSKPITQHDVVYGQPGMKDNEKGAIWLRIRTEDDKRFPCGL